ncbi:MAG: hypothetical protein ACTSU5_09205 [Promethearchaeota archaeon]
MDGESGQSLYEKYRGSYDLISYARPLGGWFYQFFFAIIGAAILALTTGFILANIYPFPESRGYNDLADKIFMIMSFVFNIPTAYAIERFIGEWRVKDPKTMVEYIRFYMWYQMLTGIGLFTFMSFYTLRMLETGNMAYAIWMILIVSWREYPAMLGIFLAAIKGLQQFQRESIINFINNTFIRPGFELGCVILGKAWGAAHPQYGALMGIAIGYAFGTYIDDFFSMFLAAAFFKKSLEPMGISLTDCLIPRVSWKVAKSSLIFGFKVSIPGVIGSFLGFTTYFWWYNMVPAYLTLSQLNKLADDIANLTKRAEGINIKATISEAYNNGKPALTQYYIAQSWKFYGFFQWGISSVIIGFMPVLVSSVLLAFGAENYLLAIPFLIPNIIHTLFEMPGGTADHVILGANRPLFKSLMDIIGTFAGFFLTWLYLFVFQLPQRYGMVAAIWLIPMGDFPILIGLLLAKWFYIHKRIVPVKIPVWQAFVAPIFPFLIVLGIATLWTVALAPAMVLAVGHLVTGLVTVLFAFIGGLMFIFIPLYTFFGGWDDYGLQVFEDAVGLAGPAKVFFVPIYKLSAGLAHLSPFHNKHPIPWEDAAQDAEDLMRERDEHDKEFKEEILE